MQTEAYGVYLQTQGVQQCDIDERLLRIRTFLRRTEETGISVEAAAKADFYRVADQMIAEGSNTIETFDAVGEYLLWAGLRSQYIALTEITDCHNGMETLADAVQQRHGVRLRNEIFAEPIPPLGADEARRYAYTRAVCARMEALLTPAQIREAWFTVQHGIPKTYWEKADMAERNHVVAGETLEEFLLRKKQERNRQIRSMQRRGALWFTMELTGEVADWITGDMHMQLGSHNGRCGILITKVPYQPAKVLHEQDSRLRRYHTCHCPLIREAILRGEPIAPEVCWCSLGHASHFLAGLGLNLEGEVLESAAQGDERCRFIFYLPDAPEAEEA